MILCTDHADYYDFCAICEIEKLEKKNQELSRIIDRAYWLIDVCDRINALKELAPYATPRDPNASHWLVKKEIE